MKISELMDAITNCDLGLPEFQRQYVWNKEQAKRLMISLLKAYPVGSLLFWKTDHPPEMKNLTPPSDRVGSVQVILDGQQRLTALYLLITGKIPYYYAPSDIESDPRDLFFNLESSEFQYYQRSLMDGNRLWWRVVECFNNADINVFEIAKQQAATDQQAFQLAQLYNEHLNRLRYVRDVDLPVQNVPTHAGLNDAINIFDWVNSQGTKLTDAELALTHVTGTWSQARRMMKQKIEGLKPTHFCFDLTFMTRALTGVVTNRALFSVIHDRSKKDLEQGWARLARILDYIVTLLPQHAYVNSTEDLNTTNVLMPWIVYLSLNDGKFATAATVKQAVHWLYAAHMWSRYTAQTDQRLEHDVSIVVRETNPWSSLRDQIIDQRGRIEVKSADLEGRGVQHPLYRMSYTLAKAHGAVDWFNGLPLGMPYGKTYSIHSHHIFPQAVLYRNGYDAENHLHRTIINEIANRAFLTADSNQGLADELPESYLPKVENAFPGALAKQFIPMDPQLWKVDRFRDFLEARRAMIAQKINEFVGALVTEPQIVHKRPIADLIGLGESATLEFKSTLQWDVVQQKASKDLRQSVLKTIAAFLNSDGGTLVIGVEDNGKACGIAEDLKVVHNSRDEFGQLIASLITDALGAEFAPFIQTRFEVLDAQLVYVVDVDKASLPAFTMGAGGKRFHVRVGNTTRALDPEEAHRYIENNWQ